MNDKGSTVEKISAYLLFKFMKSYVFKFLAVSEKIKEDFSYWAGHNVLNAITIHNPACDRLRLVATDEPDTHHWFAEGREVIVTAARLCVQKDLGTLIRAFAILRQTRSCRLLILGVGELKVDLKALSEELGVAEYICFYGFAKNPFAFFEQANLFAISSIYEGFGNVIVEALSCGCPVVSTDCPGGPREILADGAYGELVPVGDSAAFAAAMSKTLDNPPDPELLRARAREFSIEVQGPKFLQVIEEALERKEKGRRGLFRRRRNGP
jgi:glycosyltransferase involved in cell wall biosynthesis